MIENGLESIRTVANKFGSSLLDFLFPPYCPLCKSTTKVADTLCSPCLDLLPSQPQAYCLNCGGNTSQAELGCGRCLGSIDYPDRVYFPFTYDAGIVKLLVGYKFHDRSEWCSLLARLSWSRLERELCWEEPELILPVPLHNRRFLSRRYNQSALLAKELAKKLDRPLVTNGLKRIRMTKPQTKLSSQGRRDNVKGAFLADESVVSGRSLLLVDDVYTTGATVSAAVVELRRAGAKRVAVFCVARTLQD
ncbi:MAG: ComF family protein [Magnetococcales bacterium]|nr:ComF family protein [Magnetococcales bacterium]